MSFQRRHVLALAASAGTLSPQALLAQARTPLLMDGKKTLYQRVLTRPGATWVAKPGDNGGKAIEPFTVFFVYQRVEQAGQAWLLAGAGSDGKTLGYIAEAGTVPWRHMITLSFASPTARDRVLFFRERTGLMAVVDSSDSAVQSSKFLKEVSAKGALGASHPVIAAEPEKYVDLQKSFYLLPVLEAANVVLKSGHRSVLVKVASVTRDASSAEPAAPADQDSGISNYNSAVVFVMDATSSMQPYIDRTYKAMETVLRQAEENKLGKRIRFGLVAFQDDPKKTKGVEYLSKIFADPNQTATPAQFLVAMRSVKATSSSTRAYAEDAYAAIDQALHKIDWKGFGGRYIVYITDASAREGDSALASTGLSTPQMSVQAQERGVAIFALHLKTPEGAEMTPKGTKKRLGDASDHDTARTQFMSLTNWPGVGALYFPVEAGDPAKFEEGVKLMAKRLLEQVKKPQQLLVAPKSSAPKGSTPTPVDPMDAVGRAMVLSYLGREQGVKAPPMFEAWASDRDLRNRELASFQVRVLLTKNQLSDLQATVRRLTDAFGKTKLDPTNFFNELKSAATALARDPSRLGQGKAKNLQEAGLMAEYLEGLPYGSSLMGMSFDAWVNMGVGTQVQFVQNLQSKVVAYQRFHDDVDHWVKLNPDATDGDRVYPVPISELP